MKLKLLLNLSSLVLAMIMSLGVFAQTASVSGTVVSEQDGKPLSGVTVTQGDSRAVMTDENGRYSIQVPDLKGTLKFSYTGMAIQTISINGRSSINVTLSDANKELSEVIVTAFGMEQQKKAIGYSTQVVKGSDLVEARETNVANSLKGRVAGVFVSATNTGAGGSSYVNIRGASSLGGNNQPLYVVDGVPIDNQTIGAPDVNNSVGQQKDFGDGIGNILPDDIETITVLKGPNAAALYGSRGANGVILIITKKGKAGKTAKIDFNSNATFETINTTPVFQKTWGPGYGNDFSSYEDAVVDGVPVKRFPSWTGGESFGPRFDGSDVVLATWPEAGILKFSPIDEDRIKAFYKTGSTYTNTVGVSGGSDRVNYRLSLSDLRNSGIYPTSKLKRQTVSLKVGFNATSRLYFEGKLNYVRQGGENRPGNGLSINTVQTALTRAPAFLSMDLLKDYKMPDGRANNWTDGRPFNPYWILNEFLSNDSRERMIGYVMGKYKFNDWLSLQLRSGTDFYTDVRFARIGFGTPTGSGNLRRGQINDQFIKVKEENTDLLLTASGDLASKWTGSLSFGGNHLNRTQEAMSLQGNNLNIPDVYNIINAGLVVPSNTIQRKKMNSLFYTGQIAYDNFLFFDVSGRNDWSSTLGINNYSFFYPSFSTSFVFTDAFDLKTPWLDFGKIRVSYAQAGKDANPYLTQIGYSLSTVTYNGQQFANIRSSVPLVDLKNELTTSIELGAEFRLFKNRLGLDFTYYNASAKNQILGIDVPAATGFNSKLINAGEIRNRGFEFLLYGTPVKNKNLNWEVLVNFSRNRSEVVSLAPGINTLSMGSVEGATIQARPGQPYGTIVGYDFKRTPDGDYWLNASTRSFQKADTMSVLGNIQPDFLAGITNTIRYKGFSLSALIDMRIGGEIYSNSKFIQTTGGSGKFTENGDNLIAPGYYQDGDGKFVENTQVIGRQEYYSAMGWGGISEYYVIPADFVSLREVSLGYTIGKLLPKSFLKDAKLSLVGRNLLYIYRDPMFKLMGITPEASYAPTALAQGFESPGTPATRSVGVNLSFNF